MFADLVLAPGVADSRSSLSYPYTSELVNSLIKARVYMTFGDDDTESFSTFGAFGTLGADRDFRKWLHVVTHLFSGISSLPFNVRTWGCQFKCRSYPGTIIAWASLAEFNVNEFKLVDCCLWSTDRLSDHKSCRWSSDGSKQTLLGYSTPSGCLESSLFFVANPTSVLSRRFTVRAKAKSRLFGVGKSTMTWGIIRNLRQSTSRRERRDFERRISMHGLNRGCEFEVLSWVYQEEGQ